METVSIVEQNKILENFLFNFSDIQILLKKKIIYILCGGFGEERDASLYSGKEVYETLIANGYKCEMIDPALDKNRIFSLNKEKGLVFNCLHGSFGESGHISALLDYLNISYTFSGLYPSAATMDKFIFKSILKKLSLNTPRDNFDSDYSSIRGKLIHKKIRGGGSIGAYVDESFVSKEDYISEEFIESDILSLGLLEHRGHYVPLGIMRVAMNGKIFYDEEAKYQEGFCHLQAYSGHNTIRIIESCLKIVKQLGITGCARIDMIEKDNKIYFLECNSVPGLYEGSNLVYSAKLKGLSFYHLLVWLLFNANFSKL